MSSFQDKDYISKARELQLVRENMTLIGKNIRKFREQSLLSQSDLAFLIASTPSLIHKIETKPDHNISLGTLLKICDIMELDLAELFTP